MSDPGLTRRLRQQTHRSGIAVGLSMALAIVVCIAVFTVLYVKLDPWVRDFSGSEPAPTSTPHDTASNNDDNAKATEEPTEKPKATSTPKDASNSDSGSVTQDDSGDNGDFKADYQVTALEQVNLRSGPGTNFDIVQPVQPGTQLEYQNDQQAATDADNAGTNWMKFKLADGTEGWIRDVDVGKI